MKLQVGLIDISSAIQEAHKIEDPIAREVLKTLARAVDALVTNQRAMAGLSKGSEEGNQNLDQLVTSQQDLIDFKVARKFQGDDRLGTDILKGGNRKTKIVGYDWKRG